MKRVNLLVLLAIAGLLQGCVTTAISGVSTVGVVASQERSAGNAVDDVGIRLALNNLYINKDVKDLYRNVGIRVSEGRVLLTGAVDKPESKVEAVRIAWTVKGVKEVINEIQVDDKSGVLDYVRDAWISTQIRTRMLLEKNLRSVNYNVETVNGVVYLMGIAQNQEELDKAKYLAGTTSYVNKVVSHVIMKDDPRRQK
ncbi:MAG: BON domain-containing protein [Pseudomonadota bacterium]